MEETEIIMKLKTLFTSLLIILLACSLTNLLAMKGSAKSGFLVHNVDTELDYATIQGAINAPETLDGHRIRVDAGTYYERVVINKSVSLLGESMQTTIIDGNEAGHVVLIRSDNVRVIGFTIQNSGRLEGPVAPGNCGIFIKHALNCTISDNIVRDNKYGLWLVNSGGNTLERNVMIGNSYNFRVSGRLLLHFINDVDSSNTVDGKPVYYLVNRHDEQVPFDAGYVAVVNSTNMKVRNLHLTNNGQGVLFAFVKGSTVENVNATNNFDGIWIGYSSNCTVVENDVNHNGHYGIELQASSNCTVIRNNAKENGYEYIYYGYGITFRECQNCSIIENSAKNEYYGIVLFFSSNCIVSGNEASENSGMGIWPKGSERITIVGNNASNNLVYGIEPEDSRNSVIIGNNVSSNGFFGIWLYRSNNFTVSGNQVNDNKVGVGLLDSSFNDIYHNNFVDNQRQVTIEDSADNWWDNGYEGNYWNDYDGSDADEDGLGDIPYFIDEENRDEYPLMGMFSDFTVAYGKEAYQVATICNSVISGFDFNGADRSIGFDVTGEDGTLGFCRICIPKDLMNDSYHVLVDGHEPLTLRELPLSNSTDEYLYFTYMHSTLHVVIVSNQLPSIQESPTKLVIITLAIIAIITATAIAILWYKRRQRKFHTRYQTTQKQLKT